ncbi:hypothetical protein GCM10009069_28970 [Algimonas arctica]|uniref:Ferric reductase like transmembrane component n=1 Tax=Algimonas arctica TaxID=1479486 RepID=A0A8J3CT04_9PROT|nr:hypothetical protein [Algimonas arctica]GHB04581.1 hypothetical protein GCM10009069_28970 [Algimonas arctica]
MAQAKHSSFLTYRGGRWAKFALVFSVICIGLYFAFDFEPVRNGGSWYGYTLGTIGALLILWLAWLGVRKRRYNPGNWSLKAWTSAHVYLGLSLLVIGTLHTGLQFGWNVHTLAYALMVLVILSGMFGVYFYITVPRRMSDNRAEASQVEMLDELENVSRLLRETSLSLQDADTQRILDMLAKTTLKSGVMTRLRDSHVRCPNARALKDFKVAVRTIEGDVQRGMFDVISVLERRDSLLGRIRRHQRYRALLELWLWIHIPATITLIALLIVHIIAVFYYQ